MKVNSVKKIFPLAVAVMISAASWTISTVSANPVRVGEIQAQEVFSIICRVDRTIGNISAQAFPTSYPRFCTMRISFSQDAASTERLAACKLEKGQFNCEVDPGTLNIPDGFTPTAVHVEPEITRTEVRKLGCTYAINYPLGNVIDQFGQIIVIGHHRYHCAN